MNQAQSDWEAAFKVLVDLAKERKSLGRNLWNDPEAVVEARRKAISEAEETSLETEEQKKLVEMGTTLGNLLILLEEQQNSVLITQEIVSTHAASEYALLVARIEGLFAEQMAFLKERIVKLFDADDAEMLGDEHYSEKRSQAWQAANQMGANFKEALDAMYVHHDHIFKAENGMKIKKQPVVSLRKPTKYDVQDIKFAAQDFGYATGQKLRKLRRR